jgi:putative transposase
MKATRPQRKMAKKKPKDPSKRVTTLHYRIKDTSEGNRLGRLAGAVNYVWNHCNETSFHAIRNHSKFLSGIDLKNLTSGAAEELELHSVTVQAVCEGYSLRRRKKKKAVVESLERLQTSARLGPI